MREISQRDTALNLRYLLPRIARHFLPEGAARFLLRHRLLIKPGLETSDPLQAADQYEHSLEESGASIRGRQVLIFGYGGRFAVGAELLRRGAGHVVLCDHIQALDDERNLQLLPQYERYLVRDRDAVRPRPEHMTLLHGDVRSERILQAAGSVDYVFSTSVYEHLADVEGITRALAALTRPDGLHIHFVDLRDHFFSYPFEMLHYSRGTWYGWLNPSSNHNRYRLWDYRRAFEACFEGVDLTVLARDDDAFRQALPRIRPEFLSGDAAFDSVTLIRVIASRPIPARGGNGALSPA